MKIEEIKKLTDKEKEKKLKDLKMEFVKSKANSAKTGSSKSKEIKKIIARILTLSSLNKDGRKN